MIFVCGHCNCCSCHISFQPCDLKPSMIAHGCFLLRTRGEKRDNSAQIALKKKKEK